MGRSRWTRLRRWRRPSGRLRIVPLDRVVRSSFPTLTVNETQAGQIRNGRRLAGVILPDGTTALLDAGRSLPGALPPGRTGRCCRGCVCLSWGHSARGGSGAPAGSTACRMPAEPRSRVGGFSGRTYGPQWTSCLRPASTGVNGTTGQQWPCRLHLARSRTTPRCQG